MSETDVFEAFRCCITERKCQNHDCPYESKCNIANGGSNQCVQIPKHLALDVLNELAIGVKRDDALPKEQETDLCDRCGRRRLKSNREVK